MYGILLEHQELYNQAVKAYSWYVMLTFLYKVSSSISLIFSYFISSLQLLKNSESPNQNHCNIVRENYARVLWYGMKNIYIKFGCLPPYF